MLQKTILSCLTIIGLLAFIQPTTANDKYIDFETWESDSAGMSPEGWYYTINQLSYLLDQENPVQPSTHTSTGNLSLHMQTVELTVDGTAETFAGVAVNANASFSERQTIDSAPDSAVFEIDYDIAAGDTAYISFLYLDETLNLLGFDQTLFTESSNGYESVTAELDGPFQDPQDIEYVLIETVSSTEGDINSEYYLDELTMYADNITVYHEDFENWQTLNITEPERWNTSNFPWTLRGEEHVTETTDAFENNSAMRIEGYYENIAAGNAAGMFAIDNVPTRIDFGYKYEAGMTDDVAFIHKTFTNWNDTDNRRDTVGSAISTLGGATSYEVTSRYFFAAEGTEADSVSFQVFANNVGQEGASEPGSVLYLDHINMNFDPPARAELSSPDSLETEVALTPELNWYRVAGSGSYDFQLSSSETFDQADIIIDIENTEDTFYTVSGGTLDQNETYYWRVRAINQNGAGEWSSRWSFTTVDEELPAVPVLHTPENEATDVSLNPDFNWYPADNADEYHLQVAGDDAFNDLIADNESLEDTNYTDSEELDENSTYYWRVRSSNNAGYSDWSDEWEFTTEEDIINFLAQPESAEMDVNIYPNPASEEATIQFQTNVNGSVSADIYDVNGRKLTSLGDDEILKAGEHTLTIDAGELPSGVYFIHLNKPGEQSYGRLMVE